MKNILLIIAITLIGVAELDAQCFPDRHSTNWYDGWVSCELAESPNPDRWDSHWILYNFGEPYHLSKTQFWNTNDPERLDWGIRQFVVDYSLDGVSWQEWGQFELDEAWGSSTYEGQEGPDLTGIYAQYVLITALNNHGGDCYGLAEVKILIDENVATEDVAPNSQWCLSVNTFPNPFTTDATITMKNNCSDLVTYHVIDALGREVIGKKVLGTSGEERVRLNGVGLSPGIYFLVVTQGNQIQQYKIIKLKG